MGQLDLTPSSASLVRDIFEIMYLKRYLSIPHLLIPHPPSPFEGGPQSEPPTLWSIVANHNYLLGELLSHSLGDPNPQPNIPTLINEIKKSSIQLKVVKDLIHRFEKAIVSLKKEEKFLSSKNRKG